MLQDNIHPYHSMIPSLLEDLKYYIGYCRARLDRALPSLKNLFCIPKKVFEGEDSALLIQIHHFLYKTKYSSTRYLRTTDPEIHHLHKILVDHIYIHSIFDSQNLPSPDVSLRSIQVQKLRYVIFIQIRSIHSPIRWIQ